MWDGDKRDENNISSHSFSVSSIMTLEEIYLSEPGFDLDYTEPESRNLQRVTLHSQGYSAEKNCGMGGGVESCIPG